MAALTQELVDMILDILWNDQRSLGHCALVCQAWMPRCHSHIFEKIYIPADSSEKDDNRWKEITEGSPKHSSYVKSVTIERNNPRRFRLWDTLSKEMFPFQFLSQLHNLQQIEIATPISLVAHPFNQTLLLRFPSVKSLKAVGLDGASSQQVLQFLSAFPSLDHLSISRACITTTKTCGIFENLPQLKHLQISVRSELDLELCRLMSSFSITTNLRFMRVYSFAVDDVSLNDVLASCAGTLTELHLRHLSRKGNSFS